VLDYLKGGKVDAAGYGAVRTACQERIAELGRRLKSVAAAVR
jgi:hypothetical protein